jgi:anthranilate phosphoribosyltransferase
MNAQRVTIEAGNLKLGEMIARLMHGQNLTRTEAADFLEALLSPTTTDAQVKEALTSLSAKGETVEELAGMAEAMRARAVPVYSRHTRFVDTAGTGSSSVKTFNVSTAAAFVIAGAGLPVAKHGARAATSQSGSADVLEALGVNTNCPPETVERCLNEHGICFMFAPIFHSATARVARIRRELGVRTTFNLLGPLTNPARAPFQIVGVWHRCLVERVASALSLLGVRKAWVVHGADGLDEITITGESFVAACSAQETLKTFTVSPYDFGLKPQALNEFGRNHSAQNAQLIRSILAGEHNSDITAPRDLVIVNAAAALFLSGVAMDLRHAANLARESIDSGRAASKLDALIRETNRDQ